MESLFEQLKGAGYLALCQLPGRGICGLKRFKATFALLYGLDESGYDGRYFFLTPVDAFRALDGWNGKGDPGGNWIVYKGRGGDRANPNREYSIAIER